jgi:hypothetical protein
MEGNPQVLMQLAACLMRFEKWFEILPGTKLPAADETAKDEVFEDDAPMETRP